MCLCANCHKTVHFKTIKPSDIDLFGNYYKRVVDNYKHEIQQNIQNFKFKIKDANNPLGKNFEYGEAWKKYLIHIYALSKKGNITKTINLAQSVGVNTRNTRKSLQILLKKGLIVIKGEHNNRTIHITEKGEKELEMK
ncbi:MAG: hypothetical protein ACFFCC_06285 [Promethearchaeota archaeon]